MKDKVIGVVIGGPSDEREVSLNTGNAILNALIEIGYEAVAIDLDPKRIVEQLREAKIEVVFNAVHGKYGEDGLLQGILELLGIPYTGSGVLASAMAMDKGVSKRMFLAAEIPTPRSVLYSKSDISQISSDEILAGFNLPVVVKPAAQGSSIGVFIVATQARLAETIAAAFKYSEFVLVEEFIDGQEVTVAILEKDGSAEALPIIEIAPHSGQYDYHSKYTKGATDYIIPARIEAKTANEVRQAAIQAFKVLGCRGIARVDVMLDKAGNSYVLEVNTIPGMTVTSLVPKAAAATGIGFAELCEIILKGAN